MSQALKPEAILATNTSALKVGDLAAALKNPERLCGMHYFSPAEINPVVELVQAERTDPALLEQARDFLSATGKTVISCRDQTGFALNRFFCPYTNEATRCLEEGYGDAAQIDEIAKEVFGLGIGPFAVMNIVKPRINLAAINSLTALGRFYAPSDIMSKTGSADENWVISDHVAEISADNRNMIADRMQAAIFRAVLEELSENVASGDDIDLGAKMAFRFGNGPVAMMKATGRDKVEAMLAGISDRGHADDVNLSRELDLVFAA